MKKTTKRPRLQSADLRVFLTKHPEVTAVPATEYVAGKTYFSGNCGNVIHTILEVRTEGSYLGRYVDRTDVFFQDTRDNGTVRTHGTDPGRWDWELVGLDLTTVTR